MADRHLILLVEETDHSLGFYDSLDGSLDARIRLGYRPHEITVTRDGRTAYVSNFGLHDYDLATGHAGNSISVVDIANRCESHRLYTCTDKFQCWAPHGVKLSPDGRHLYVNVERAAGRDPTGDASKMLVFDVATREIVRTFAMPRLAGHDEPTRTYGLPRGSHNFVFSPDGRDIWIFSGHGGITRIDPRTGRPTAHLKDFRGAVRGLLFTGDGQLLVSSTNQLSFVDPRRIRVTRRIGNLGVTQLLYSDVTPDGRYALAPAVWESQVVVVDLARGKVVARVPTGVDPVHVVVAPGHRSAYVTHGRGRWCVEIELGSWRITRQIATRGGPNGVDVAPWMPRPRRGRLVFGASLPFTGEYAPRARELRLGHEFWQNRVNAAGGILADGRAHEVVLAFSETVPADAQFLFGSYPGDANLAVARMGWPLVTATGNEKLFAAGLKHVFGLNTLADVELAGTITALRRRLDPKPRTVAVLACTHRQARAEAKLTARLARQLGLKPLGIVHDVKAARKLNADVVLVVAGTGTSKRVVIECRQRRYAPPALALNCGITSAAFRRAVGDAGQNLFGCVQWSESLAAPAHDRFVTGEDYARDFRDEYSDAPTDLAAGASACGVVFERAIAAAGTTEPRPVIAALRAMRCPTFYGPVRFDQRGRNVAKPMITVQLRRDAAGTREIALWPPEIVGANVPAWCFTVSRLEERLRDHV